MWNAAAARILTLTVAILAIPGNKAGAQPASSPREDMALIGATIYVDPGQEPIRDGVVVIEQGKIATVGSKASVRVPRNARKINCSGRTITAGFWNSHVHFFERKWADAKSIPAAELGRQIVEMLTRYGFTSVFDLGSEWENTRIIRDRVEGGEVPGPHIRSTGDALFPPGVLPSEQVFNVLGIMKSRKSDAGVADAAQAAVAAKAMLDAGVDAIKLHSFTDESTMQAAADVAHHAGKPVFAHTRGGGANLLAAVQAGVDVIAHTTPVSDPWDETIIATMKQHRVALIPTLQIWKSLRKHDRISAQEKFMNVAKAQLRSWLNAGGAVLFGTDVGAVDYDPTEEYTLLSETGMTFPQILAALTTAPAERFGESKKSAQVAAGFQAD